MGEAEYAMYVVMVIVGCFLVIWAIMGIVYLGENEGSKLSKYIGQYQHDLYEKERAVINLMIRGPVCWAFLLYLVIFKWLPWSRIWNVIANNIPKLRT